MRLNSGCIVPCSLPQISALFTLVIFINPVITGQPLTDQPIIAIQFLEHHLVGSLEICSSRRDTETFVCNRRKLGHGHFFEHAPIRSATSFSRAASPVTITNHTRRHISACQSI